MKEQKQKFDLHQKQEPHTGDLKIITDRNINITNNNTNINTLQSPQLNERLPIQNAGSKLHHSEDQSVKSQLSNQFNSYLDKAANNIISMFKSNDKNNKQTPLEINQQQQQLQGAYQQPGLGVLGENQDLLITPQQNLTRKLQSQYQQSMDQTDLAFIKEQVQDENMMRNQTQKFTNDQIKEIYIRPKDIQINTGNISSQNKQLEYEDILVVDKAGEDDPVTPPGEHQRQIEFLNGQADINQLNPNHIDGKVIDSQEIMKNQKVNKLYEDQNRVLREQQEMLQKYKANNRNGNVNSNKKNPNYEQLGEYYKQKKQVKAISKREVRIQNEMDQILARAFLDNLTNKDQVIGYSQDQTIQKQNPKNQNAHDSMIRKQVSDQEEAKLNAQQQQLVDLEKFNLITESDLSMTHQSFIGNQMVLSHDKFLQDPNGWGLMFQDHHYLNNAENGYLIKESPFQNLNQSRSNQLQIQNNHDHHEDEHQFNLDLQKAIKLSQKVIKNQRPPILDSSLQKAQDQNLKQFIINEELKYSFHQQANQKPPTQKQQFLEVGNKQNNPITNQNNLMDSHAQYYVGSLQVSPMKQIENNIASSRGDKLRIIQGDSVPINQNNNGYQGTITKPTISTPNSGSQQNYSSNTIQNKAITQKVAQHLRQDDSPRMNDVDDNPTDPSQVQIELSNKKVEKKNSNVSDDTNPSSNPDEKAKEDGIDSILNINGKNNNVDKSGKGILKGNNDKKKNNGCCSIF